MSQINCLVLTVDEGSVTAAARALGVSPQAVSKSLRDLERTLGRPLFVRRASGLKPTAYGLTFCRRARHMLREAEELDAFSKGDVSSRRSHLVLLLCIPKIANFSSLSQRISSFIYGRLGIPANVDHCPFEQCVERLAFGEADAFITVGKTALDDLDVHVIDSVEVGALVLRTHPLAARDVVHLADVADYPLYFTGEFPFFTKTVLDAIKQAPTPEGLRLRLLTMSIQGIFDALVSQEGCVIMPSIEGVDDWLPRTTSIPFDTDELGRVPLCLVTTPEGKSDYARAIEGLLVGGHGTRQGWDQVFGRDATGS